MYHLDNRHLEQKSGKGGTGDFFRGSGKTIEMLGQKLAPAAPRLLCKLLQLSLSSLD